MWQVKGGHTCFDTSSIKKSQLLPLNLGGFSVYTESGELILALVRLGASTSCPCNPWLTRGSMNCSVRTVTILGQRPRDKLPKALKKARVFAGFSLPDDSVLSIWDINLGWLISYCPNTTIKLYLLRAEEQAS